MGNKFPVLVGEEVLTSPAAARLASFLIIFGI
jgi:hypothetical protein